MFANQVRNKSFAQNALKALLPHITDLTFNAKRKKNQSLRMQQVEYLLGLIRDFEFTKNPFEENYSDFPLLGHSMLPVVASSGRDLKNAIIQYRAAMISGRYSESYFYQLTGCHPCIEHADGPAYVQGCQCGRKVVIQKIEEIPETDLFCCKCGQHLLHYYNAEVTPPTVIIIRNAIVGTYCNAIIDLGLIDYNFYSLMMENGLLLDTIFDNVDALIEKALADPEIDEPTKDKYRWLYRNGESFRGTRFLDALAKHIVNSK